MSKSEILDELPRMPRGERREILERIWEMEEAEVLKEGQPGEAEKKLLDSELEEFQANPKAGDEWHEVEARLRRNIRK